MGHDASGTASNGAIGSGARGGAGSLKIPNVTDASAPPVQASALFCLLTTHSYQTKIA